MPGLSDFQFTDIKQWEQQVIEDLKLKSIQQFPSIQLSPEITQQPYVDSSTAAHHLVDKYRNCTAYAGEDWKGVRYWRNMEQVEGQDLTMLNKLSLQALSGGADGVIFSVNEISNWQQLLNGFSLDHCSLGIESTFGEILSFFEYIENQKSVLGGFAVITDLQKQLSENPEELFNLLNGNSKYRMLVLKESTERPGTLSELALILSQGIHTINTLMEANIPISTILNNLQVSLTTSEAYLWEICRLKCLRILFHQMIAQYGVSEYQAADLGIQVTTGYVASPENDPNLPLLTNTTQGMAAVLGGCDILTVIPHRGGFCTTDEDSRRIARNIGHILREECHLHRVTDVVAGSYYLEDLTGKMLRVVWSKLQQLELSGGYRRVVNDNDSK